MFKVDLLHRREYLLSNPNTVNVRCGDEYVQIVDEVAIRPAAPKRTDDRWGFLITNATFLSLYHFIH